MTITCESLNTAVAFQKNPFLIDITNTLTGERVCISGKQSILVRSPLELFEPTILTELKNFRRDADGVSFTVADVTKRYRALVRAEPSRHGIRFHMDVTGPKPIWLIEWRLSGFQCEEVIIPALGGQSLSRDMPRETTLSYKYPFWWNAQFVIAAKKKGGCWIRTMDGGPLFKMLRVRRDDDGFSLTYGFEANAPIQSRHLSATWYLDCFGRDWKEAASAHRDWMEKEFRLTLLHSNIFFPEWANKINFILEMWGITKDRPEPLHTFDVMVERLRKWRELHSPDQTLVYLPGFAEHGIDSHAPDCNPAAQLGGPKKFKYLVETAHAMGYRVMAHTNVLAMTFTHRLYPKFRRHQVVDLFDRPQGWGLDMDGDWLAEPYFAYINPGARVWGDLMENVLGDLLRKFDLDAVFLDQTLLAFNVNKGPNFLEGMRNHVKRLQRAFPHVLFAGEGLHEQIVGALPMAQIHGIDSIAEIHGMDRAVRWRRAHPVSTFLFGRYTRFVAHLLTKHPSHPFFGMQEEAYERLGVIPALCLYYHAQELDMLAVRKMVRRAKKLNFADAYDEDN